MPREKRKGPADVAADVGRLARRPLPPELAKLPKKKGRDRSWEERQRNARKTTQVSYRGIPRDLNQAIKDLAKERGLTVSEVAAHLLAVGLEEVRAGRRGLP